MFLTRRLSRQFRRLSQEDKTDYTTLALVKESLRSDTLITVDDARLSHRITDASRTIDRKATGVADAGAVDYFKLETVSSQIVPGRIDHIGKVLCYPRKPMVTAVTAFAYRVFPMDEWKVIADLTRTFFDGPRVEAYPLAVDDNEYLTKCQVRISYSGGMAATVGDLPADFVNLATLLALRFYREEETGLSDAIGVAEASPQGVVYTKEFPARFLAMLQPYMRQVGWRYVS